MIEFWIGWIVGVFIYGMLYIIFLIVKEGFFNEDVENVCRFYYLFIGNGIRG